MSSFIDIRKGLLEDLKTAPESLSGAVFVSDNQTHVRKVK